MSFRIACLAWAHLLGPWHSWKPQMRPLLAGLVLAVYAIWRGSPVQAQTFQAVPLDCGGWFSGFAQAADGRLYGYGDVFGAWRSDDGGMSWRYLNWSMPGGDIVGTGMAVQQDNADVVYYATNRALSKSTNGGTSWRVLLNDVGDNPPRFRGTSPILIRSDNPDELWFAGPRKNQTGWLWKSSDGGDNWVKAGGTAFDTNRARTLHNITAFANQIWVGSDNGLHVSTDGGTSFALVGGSGRLSGVGMIARFTSGPFTGVGLVTRSNGGSTNNPGGISRITATDYNDATTYSVSDSPATDFSFGYPTGLQIFSDGSSSAWNTSADRHGFSPAGDGGRSFTRRATTLNTVVVPIWATAEELAARNRPGGGTDHVIEAVGNPNKWLITGGKAPMYSLDKGLSWQYFPNGSGLAGVKTYLASPSRYDADRVYIPGSDQGSFIITDGGRSGQAAQCSHQTYSRLHSTFRVLEGPDPQNLVLAGVDQTSSTTVILRSADGGASWAPVSQSGNGLPPSLDGITKAVMSFTNANDFLVVLASGFDPNAPGANPGVWRTTDGGTSFRQVEDLPTTGLSTGFRYGASHCFLERDAVQADVRYFIARGAAFYRSTNGGTNWPPRTHPFGLQVWAWDLHADPMRGDNLWAAGDYAGVKVSRDGGQTWTSTAEYMNARLVSSCDGKIAVFGSKAGDTQPRLYYSTDDGATFTPLTPPPGNFHGVSGITVDRTGKVWVSWNSVTVVTPPPGTVTGTQTALAQASSTVQVYPNPTASSFRVSTATDGATITVTTLTGQVLRTVKARGKETTIAAGTWLAGLYLVRVQAGTETAVKKVMIAH